VAQRLKNKVTIVTGAGTKIGEAIACAFAREGARVVVSDAAQEVTDRVVQQITENGGQAVGFIGDVSDEAQAKDCVEFSIDQYGRLDVLVNQAGVLVAMQEAQEFPVDAFDRSLRLNLRSAFLMTKYALPHLQQTGGNIISSGSESENSGLPLSTPFGGARAWMHAFMKGIALEQAPHGIRANCVCPGPVDSAWVHTEDPALQEQVDQIAAQSATGRRSTPDEIANVYAFLASDMASYVTGALWTVDGNITISAAAMTGQSADFAETAAEPPAEERVGLPPPEPLP
jgi:NAD(P)-dependent dehydrogenase (short-subunit alcohol dehydrogenase family)